MHLPIILCNEVPRDSESISRFETTRDKQSEYRGGDNKLTQEIKSSLMYPKGLGLTITQTTPRATFGIKIRSKNTTLTFNFYYNIFIEPNIIIII